jgi:hypothetical protein
MVGFHRYWLAYAIPPHRNGISNASFQQHTAQAYIQLGQSTPYGLLRGGPCGLTAVPSPVRLHGTTPMDRLDIRGLMAGFVLSLVIGAVLYAYLTVG